MTEETCDKGNHKVNPRLKIAFKAEPKTEGIPELLQEMEIKVPATDNCPLPLQPAQY